MANLKKQVTEELIKQLGKDAPIKDIIKAVAAVDGCELEKHRLYLAWKRGMPKDKVREAGFMLLSKNSDDRSAARDLIYQWTGRFGIYVQMPRPVLPVETKRVIYEPEKRFNKASKRKASVAK